MHHYFIGKLLNPEDSKNLIGAQGYIERKTKSKKVVELNAKFAYLGYMDDATFLELQDKISNITGVISEKFKAQECVYTGFGITGEKTTKKSVSIMYKNDVITQILVPYLRSFISTITNESNIFYPHISLARINTSDINQELESFVETIRVPKTQSFTIDSLDIMKGIPKVIRSGPSSKLDDMDMELVQSYKLVGSI